MRFLTVFDENILKPKQVICLEHLYLQSDVICILPTGYGKSLVFQLLPGLMFAKDNLEDVCLWEKDISEATTIIIVVSPLNALISNQISRLSSSGIRASVLGVKIIREDNEIDLIECDLRLCEDDKLRAGHYHIVFAHPESFILCRYGRELLSSEVYQDKICAVVIDEAHCILEWYVCVTVIVYCAKIYENNN